MRAVIALMLTTMVAEAQVNLRLRETRLLNNGSVLSNYVFHDLDSNGLAEVIFFTPDMGSNPARWEIWEYKPVNRLRLVFADTGVYPYPPGIELGNAWIFAGDYIDDDRLFDLVVELYENVAPGEYYYRVGVLEQTRNADNPFALVWSTRWQIYHFGYSTVGDLDQDGRKEILGPRIYECTGDNQFQQVYPRVSRMIGDFDCDSLMEFASVWWCFSVMENVIRGQDTYALVYMETTELYNACDWWTGKDLDQDGWNEMFACFDLNSPRPHTYKLYMWEANGNNSYERTCVDTKFQGDGFIQWSICTDIDGDGVQELIWVLPRKFYVYKATGNNRFTQVYEWPNESGLGLGISAAYDLNGNGYQELILGNFDFTLAFEVEAVRMLDPSGPQILHSGESYTIRWRVYQPPRCDSVSLFLLTDTVIPEGARFWHLDTIVTGLAPTESSYIWQVPDTTIGWAKIVAIAYGPGWQFDLSDSAFAIVRAGGAVEEPVMVRDWALEGAMLPAGLRVRYAVPCPSVIRLGLYDITGRLVQELEQGRKEPGRYELQLKPDAGAGVYFLRLDSDVRTECCKLVIAR